MCVWYLHVRAAQIAHCKCKQIPTASATRAARIHFRTCAGEICCQGLVPTGTFARNCSQRTCTGHMSWFPLQQQARRRTPLPPCKFFLELSMMQISSPSLQMAALCSPCCGIASHTQTGKASDGSRRSQVYAINHNAVCRGTLSRAIMALSIVR